MNIHLLHSSIRKKTLSQVFMNKEAANSCMNETLKSQLFIYSFIKLDIMSLS